MQFTLSALLISISSLAFALPAPKLHELLDGTKSAPLQSGIVCSTSYYGSVQIIFEKTTMQLKFLKPVLANQVYESSALDPHKLYKSPGVFFYKVPKDNNLGLQVFLNDQGTGVAFWGDSIYEIFNCAPLEHIASQKKLQWPERRL